MLLHCGSGILIIKNQWTKIVVEENVSSYEQGKNCLGLRKVLRINWDIDLLEFNFDKIIQLAKEMNFTKRNLFIKN